MREEEQRSLTNMREAMRKEFDKKWPKKNEKNEYISNIYMLSHLVQTLEIRRGEYLHTVSCICLTESRRAGHLVTYHLRQVYSILQ